MFISTMILPLRMTFSALQRSLLAVFMLLVYTQVWATTERFESDSYSFAVSAIPEWVEQVDLPAFDRSKARRGEGMHYLMSEWQTLIDNGTQIEYTRIAYMPMNETGMEDAASISIDFHPQYESLEMHYITVTRNGKQMDKLDAKAVRLIQQERDIDKLMYNGTVTALLVLEDIRVGDIIDYSYSVKGVNPVFGDKYFSSYALGWQVGVDVVRVRLVTPKKRRLNMRSYNTQMEPEIKTTASGLRAFTWQVNSSKPLVDEGDYPDWYYPYPWIQVSEYNNWREVNEWATRLFVYEGGMSKALHKKISEWKIDKNDPEAAVREALSFVQNEIRYFGVELGQNSHRPSHPNDVVSRRYGDCKDKALLLTAILRSWGITAYPALVSTSNNKAVSDWLPSPGVFDHVIVKANIKGKDFWLDGTTTYQRGKLDQRGVQDYGKALLVGSRMRNLDSMTRPKGYAPKVKVEEYFLVTDYKKPVEFTVTSTYTHDEAEWKRSYFSNRSAEEIGSRYVNFYASIYPGIEQVHEVEIHDNQEANVVQVVESYVIHDFWDRDEGKMYSTFYGSTIKDYTNLPRIINRKMPLAISYPIQVEHVATLQYPEDIGFEGIDAEIEISDKSMDFFMRSSYADMKLKVEYKYESKNDAVMPAGMVKHMAKRRKINDNLYFSAWITDSEFQANADKTRISKMKSLLGNLMANRE